MRDEAIQRYYERVNDEVIAVRAGVDWISCTLDRDAPLCQAWVKSCHDALLDIAAEGHQIGDFGINGYRGVMVGGSFIGQREDGFFCQFSGRHADVYLGIIMRDDIHVSRIDLAVTVQFRVMPTSLGATSFAMAVEADRGLASSRRRKLWYMSGSDGGYTCYIGSPSSDQRGRMYNKEVQSGIPEYERTWRYETVYRNARAMAIAETLRENAIDDRYAICSFLVGKWYKSRGVRVPWETTADYAVLPQIAEKPSDATKKLAWLAKQVKPAVLWLIEHGYGGEVKNALGMGD